MVSHEKVIMVVRLVSRYSGKLCQKNGEATIFWPRDRIYDRRKIFTVIHPKDGCHQQTSSDTKSFGESIMARNMYMQAKDHCDD
jgi:hypothetical protein